MARLDDIVITDMPVPRHIFRTICLHSFGTNTLRPNQCIACGVSTWKATVRISFEEKKYKISFSPAEQRTLAWALNMGNHYELEFTHSQLNGLIILLEKHTRLIYGDDPIPDTSRAMNLIERLRDELARP